MFPIPFNFPFRKANGDISTIGAEINAGGGGGSSYTLPTASAETKGGVKVGDGLTMDGEVLKNTNPTPYTLPTASDETLGGVKVGTGLSIDEGGVLSASGGSSSSCHMYNVVTNNNMCKEFTLITSDDIDTSTANINHIYQAIKKGFGIITKGNYHLSSSDYAPKYLQYISGDRAHMYYEAAEVVDNNKYKIVELPSSVTLSSINKLF